MIDFSSPRHRHKLGYLLIAPALIMMALIIVYPILLSVDISFQDVKIARIGTDRKPFSLASYEWLFASAEFYQAIWVTVKLLFVVGGTALFIGFGTALLLNQRFRGRPVARLLMILPWAVPEVVAVVIWSWMLDSSFGVFNWLLLTTSLISEPIAFVSNPTAAFLSVCMVMIWKGYPFICIMLLAGLQSIPEEQYQAAAVDGANAYQRFWHVTIPNMLPVLGVSFVMTALWVFRDFAIIFVLTEGGPIGATKSLAIMTFEQSFQFFRMGRGAAVGVVTLIICAIMSRALVSRFARSVV